MQQPPIDLKEKNIQVHIITSLGPFWATAGLRLPNSSRAAQMCMETPGELAQCESDPDGLERELPISSQGVLVLVALRADLDCRGRRGLSRTESSLPHNPVCCG